MSASLNFNNMTVTALKAYAKQNNIKVKSNLKKADLVDIISKHANLVGEENEDSDVEREVEEIEEVEGVDSSMTIKDIKKVAQSLDIKIPSSITKKNTMINYVNAYIKERSLGFDPSDLGSNKIDFDELTPIYVDLEKYSKYGSKAWIKHLFVHGWTVVPNVFDDETINESIDSAWGWLNACETDIPVEHDNPETWSYDSFPSGKFGMIKNYIGHETFLWNLRRKAKHIFESIYTDRKTKEVPELVSSFDGMICSFPTESKNFASWFHFDQPRDMDSSFMNCVQGIACLTDSGEEDGGFCFMLPEDKNVGEYIQEYYENHPSSGIIWGKVNMNDQNVSSCPIFKVCANAGDMILFDSRLMHCNAPPQKNEKGDNYRMATYISFQPRDNLNQEEENARMKMFEDGVMSGHWCYGSWFTPSSKDYNSYGKKKVSPPDLYKPSYDEVEDMI